MKALSAFFLVFILLPQFFQTEPPDLKVNDVRNRPINIFETKNRLTLFLFGNDLKYPLRSVLSYCQVLLNLYQDRGLSIISVLCDDRQNIIDFIGRGRITYPVIMNCDRKITRALNFCTNCGGFLLLNDKGKVIFSNNGAFEKETIRQIIESEITGSVNFAFTPIENHFFRLNESASSIRLRDLVRLNSLPTGLFREKHLIITFFSSFCGFCRSGNRIKTLEEFVRTHSIRDGNYKMILAFIEPLENADISLLVKQKNSYFFLCSSEDIFSDREKYLTNDLYKTDPLTIVLDEARRVVFIEKPGDSEENILRAIAENAEGNE